MHRASAPAHGTVERWAWDYVRTTSLSAKLAPAPPPSAWEDAPAPRRVDAPGRPPELCVTDRADKTRGLAAPSGRARALHTFLHHELQAAELMAWAILAFPGAPRAFREGLLRIALDETRHMRMYAEQIERLETKQAEYREWFRKQEEARRKAEDNVSAILARMRPEAAAAQLAAMEEASASVLLQRMSARNASAVLNEMPPAKAARLAAAMTPAPVGAQGATQP